ncbi:hypothetical protein CVIRNUC_003693 [Coccomyxa viridis]|uniref:Uncharacterized protein n=1 Tax=Coccomyxa viridis TaxID=1274662 RepID=A0AAV1I067_9CHLO|nr:hypothetical protein CVIRNUC_003693 [Coccomyxa viridis]
MKDKELEVKEAMVAFKPTSHICQHLCAFHFYAHDLSRQVEAHHYCSKGEEDGVMFQCIIYDDDAPSAKLIGVEYIISRDTYASLDSEEQKLWHSHAYEVQSGMLYDPKGDSRADLPHMEALMTTYGKTWHTWQVDQGHKVPLGDCMVPE